MVLTSNFVVQSSNFRDMHQYVKISDALGFDEINFQKIDDWGTFKNFNDHAIWKKSHPQYQEFLLHLTSPIMKNKKINLTNLADIANEIK